MKVMIIGAAGFIGSTLAAHLIRQSDCYVVSVDDLSGPDHAFNLEPVLSAKSRHSFHIASVFDTRIIRNIIKFEKPDGIIFSLSPDVDYGQSITNLLDATSDLPGVQIQFAMAITSDSRNAYTNELSPQWAKDSRITKIETCQVFGPRQSQVHLVPSTIRATLSGMETSAEEIEQEWLYVGDLCTAILAILKAANMEASYFVSCGAKATKAQVVKQIRACMSGESEQIVSNTTQTVPPALSVLGWKPKYELAASLEHTAQWFSQNKWAFR